MARRPLGTSRWQHFQNNVANGWDGLKEGSGYNNLNNKMSISRQVRRDRRDETGGIKGKLARAPKKTWNGIKATWGFFGRVKNGLNEVSANRQKGNYNFMVLLSILFWVYDSVINQLGTGVSNYSLHVGICAAFLLMALVNHNTYGDSKKDFIGMFVITIFYLGFPFVQNSWANMWLRILGGASGNLGVSIAYLLSMRVMFPLWLLYYMKKKGTDKSLFVYNAYIVIWVLLFVLSGIVGVYANNFPNMAPVQVSLPTIGTGLKEGWTGLKSGWSSALNGTTSWWSGNVDYATGGQYEGEVESYENEPLGVSIEKVFAASSGFYEGTPVAVWGQIWGRTLDKPIPIKLSCYTGTDKKKIFGEIRPNESVEITTEDVRDFECLFKEGLEPGYHQVYVKAEYNFVTMSYLKAYFMELSRMRSLNRQEIDPYDHFQISDRLPIAKYTNGPVKVGMETTQPLMGVSTVAEENIFTPAIGISIDGDWMGKLEKINSLVVSTPDTIAIKDCYPNFKGGIPEEGRNVYELNKSITDHLDYGRTFRCLMDFSDPTTLLSNSPFTVEYFRATVDYDFSTEEFTNVNVFPLPEVDGGVDVDLGPYNVLDDLSTPEYTDFKSFTSLEQVYVLLDDEILSKSYNSLDNQYEFVDTDGVGFAITMIDNMYVVKILGLNTEVFRKETLSTLLEQLDSNHKAKGMRIKFFHASQREAIVESLEGSKVEEEEVEVEFSPPRVTDFNSFIDIEDVNIMLDGEFLIRSFSAIMYQYEFSDPYGVYFSISYSDNNYIFWDSDDIEKYRNESLGSLLKEFKEDPDNKNHDIEIYHNSEISDGEVI